MFNLKNRMGGENTHHPFLGSIWENSNNGIGSGILTNIFNEKRKEIIRPYMPQKEIDSIKKMISDKMMNENGDDTILEQSNVIDSLISDIYSIYLNENFKRKEKLSNNTVRQRIIDSVYNTFIKDVTNECVPYSRIMASKLAHTLINIPEIREELEKEEQNGKSQEGQGENNNGNNGDPQDNNDNNEHTNDSNSGDNNDSDQNNNGNDKKPGKGKNDSTDGNNDDQGSSEQKIDNILNDNKNHINDSIGSALKEIKDLEDQLGKDRIKYLSKTEGNFLERIKKLKEKLHKIYFSRDSISNVLKQILNKSENYFSKRHKVIEESIFESEDFDDISGLEFLDPIFGMAEIMNVINLTKKYEGKIDVYLDSSGSMNGEYNVQDSRMNLKLLVKGMALELYRMGMIEKLYFFTTSLYEIDRINELSILEFNNSGGTSFDTIVQQCQVNKRNSLIITDGEDHVSTYLPNIFWIGVGNANFNNVYNHRNDKFDIYKSNKQCAVFNHSNGLIEYVI